MTPEQFIFWLSGYFTGGRENDAEAIVDDIKIALKQVKLPCQTVFFSEHG